ncbi:hypothetical protein QO231_24945 [Sedimentitalea todarodis]|uniref:ABC transmembrane type-1 domain-containing protein n=1 Tax=Sedimentitalea todarodis TaxID=1631240 RepID=A0ABU3VLH7_9RHOB|nr:hypothetical protein [Sedimentitalea todarodis]
MHHAAFGVDLLRAPTNVVLAPVFLVTRLTAIVARALRFDKVAHWLSRRKILFETTTSRQVANATTAFIAHLNSLGLGVAAPPDVVERKVADYAGVRNAVGEIMTTIVVLIVGYMFFRTATPGVISLAEPVAQLRAQSTAIEQFPLGQGLGRMYYEVFPTVLAPWQVVTTGVVLLMLTSIVTTFAGVVADPIQVLTGTHRRRLMNLLRRLDADQIESSGLAREHVAARLSDFSDMALGLWRMLRG